MPTRARAATALSAVVAVGLLGATAQATTLKQTSDIAKLTLSGQTQGNQLGTGVAAAGSTLVVGAPYRTIGSNLSQGSVEVFTEPKSGWRTTSKAVTLTAGNGAAGDHFGTSVAISGNTIAVGAPGRTVGTNTDQGVVYVFRKPASGWASTSHPVATLTTNDGALGDATGAALAISGGTIVAGLPGRSDPDLPHDGAAVVFTEPKSGWANEHQAATLTAKDAGADDNLGTSVAVAGSTIVLGAPLHASDRGAAYVYQKPPSGWTGTRTETGELSASDGAANDHFGSAVAVSGSQIAVGADYRVSQAGGAYVYLEPAAGWAHATTQQAELLPPVPLSIPSFMGDSIAIVNGEVVAGARLFDGATGGVVVYDEPAAGWSGTPNPREKLVGRGATNQYGIGAAIALTGSTVLAGAPTEPNGDNANVGAAYVFSVPIKPRLTAVEQTRATWTLGDAEPAINPSHAPKASTTFIFRLNVAAKVALSFDAVKGTKKTHKATLTVAGRSGVNRLFFDGRVRKHTTLATGKYVVAIHAKTSGGASATKTLTFTIR